MFWLGLYAAGVGLFFLVSRIHYCHSIKASIGLGLSWPAIALMILVFFVIHPREVIREMKREFFQWNKS